MGMFSREKTTYVSSQAFNLAGDEDNRYNFLKTNVITSAIGNRHIAESLTKSYVEGPGIKLRGYPKWSRDGDYINEVGLISGNVTTLPIIDLDILASQIPHAAAETVFILSTSTGLGDYSYWAEQHILENYPERINTAYTLDIFPVGLLGATHSILITFEDLTSDTIYPSGFSTYTRFLYATYNLVTEGSSGSVTTGTEVEIPIGDPYPSTAGYTQDSTSSVITSVSLNEITTVDVTYSDATSPEHTVTTVTTSDSYTELHEQYSLITSGPVVPGIDDVSTLTTLLYLDFVGSVLTTTTSNTVVEDLGGGVFKTTITSIATDTLILKKSHRTDTRIDTIKSFSKPKIFIYGYLTGNSVLDAMFADVAPQGIFFPPIPVRINNMDVKDEWSPALYEAGRKAFRRATGGKLDDIRKSVNDNEQLEDIDYAYVAFGVSLNVKENACKKYIYNFFHHLMLNSENAQAEYDNFKADWAAAKASHEAWAQWREDFILDLATLAEEPTRLSYPVTPKQSIHLRSDRDTDLHYQISIDWNYIVQNTGTGLYDPSLSTGKFMFTTTIVDEFSEAYWGENADGVMELKYAETAYSGVVKLVWQIDENTWSSLSIVGLTHSNYVYNDKWVETKGYVAINDPDESGFIIPLHEDIYKAMSIKDSTQMSTACCFIIFNSYTEVKEKWYQTSGFRVFMLIIAVVVSIFNAPAGVGIAMATMSVQAIVMIIIQAFINAVINMMIAMILAELFTIAATALFGDKVGRIVGSVAAVVAMAYVGSATGTSNFDINTLTTAPNLLMLTQVTLDAYSQYIVSQANKTMVEMNEYAKEASATLKTIQDKYAEDFGSNGFILDPLALVDSAKVFYETSETFLQRTTMTGVDIVETSLDVIHNFVEITMSNRLPLEI